MMPDRRIDAIGKADAPHWNSLQLPKNSPNLVKIISGALSHMQGGEVMRAMVQKAGNGMFKITLNGESFIIKGLPTSLVGKEVAFIAQKSPLHTDGKTELFWIGASQLGKPNQQGLANKGLNPQTLNPQGLNQQGLKQLGLNQLSPKQPGLMQQPLSPKTGQHISLLSALPAGLKSGQTLSGRIEAIQGQQMSLSMISQDGQEPTKNIRHQMLATSIKGMVQGQSISANIMLAANNKPMLEIITPQPANQAISKTGSMPNMAALADFKLAAGDTAAAFVQQRLGNGYVQLHIQGMMVEAPAPESINKGDMLMLKMIKPPAGFQVLSVHKNAAAKALAIVKANLSINHPPMAQQMTAISNVLSSLPTATVSQMPGLPPLETALQSMTMNERQPLNGKRLGQMLHNAGAGLEAKLLSLSKNPSLPPSLQQDLKSIMLQLVNAPAGSGQYSKIISLLSELAQQGVSRIETTQALNVLAHMQGDAMRVELPMLVNQQMINVQLSLQQHHSYTPDDADDNNPSDQSYDILFALELSNLGKVRVEANISDNAVHARIYNESPTSNQFMLDHIERLESRLHSLGFEKVYLLSSQQSPDIEKQQRFDQLTNMTPASLSLLDIRV